MSRESIRTPLEVIEDVIDALKGPPRMTAELKATDKKYAALKRLAKR